MSLFTIGNDKKSKTIPIRSSNPVYIETIDDHDAAGDVLYHRSTKTEPAGSLSQLVTILAKYAMYDHKFITIY